MSAVADDVTAPAPGFERLNPDACARIVSFLSGRDVRAQDLWPGGRREGLAGCRSLLDHRLLRDPLRWTPSPERAGSGTPCAAMTPSGSGPSCASSATSSDTRRRSPTAGVSATGASLRSTPRSPLLRRPRLLASSPFSSTQGQYDAVAARASALEAPVDARALPFPAADAISLVLIVVLLVLFFLFVLLSRARTVDAEPCARRASVRGGGFRPCLFVLVLIDGVSWSVGSRRVGDGAAPRAPRRLRRVG